MKYSTCFVILITLLAIDGCRKVVSENKEEQSAEKPLRYHDDAQIDFRFGNFDSLLINQAMGIADFSQDAQPDSSYREPGIYYKWQVTPSSGCDSLVNYNGHGSVQAIFHCAGDYGVYADIYDSATNERVGYTDTVILHVKNGTLVEFTSFQQGDKLDITGGGSFSYPYESDSIYLWFNVNTTREYSLFVPSQIAQTDSTSATDFYASFTGLCVATYPYIDRPDKFTSTTGASLRIPFYATDSSSKNIHINYGGNTYTGTIERTSVAYLIHWNYTSGVVFTTTEIKR